MLCKRRGQVFAVLFVCLLLGEPFVACGRNNELKKEGSNGLHNSYSDHAKLYSSFLQITGQAAEKTQLEPFTILLLVSVLLKIGNLGVTFVRWTRTKTALTEITDVQQSLLQMQIARCITARQIRFQIKSFQLATQLYFKASQMMLSQDRITSKPLLSMISHFDSSIEEVGSLLNQLVVSSCESNSVMVERRNDKRIAVMRQSFKRLTSQLVLDAFITVVSITMGAMGVAIDVLHERNMADLFGMLENYEMDFPDLQLAFTYSQMGAYEAFDMYRQKLDRHCNDPDNGCTVTDTSDEVVDRSDPADDADRSPSRKKVSGAQLAKALSYLRLVFYAYSMIRSVTTGAQPFPRQFGLSFTDMVTVVDLAIGMIQAIKAKQIFVAIGCFVRLCAVVLGDLYAFVPQIAIKLGGNIGVAAFTTVLGSLNALNDVMVLIDNVANLYAEIKIGRAVSSELEQVRDLFVAESAQKTCSAFSSLAQLSHIQSSIIAEWSLVLQQNIPESVLPDATAEPAVPVASEYELVQSPLFRSGLLKEIQSICDDDALMCSHVLAIDAVDKMLLQEGRPYTEFKERVRRAVETGPISELAVSSTSRDEKDLMDLGFRRTMAIDKTTSLWHARGGGKVVITDIALTSKQPTGDDGYSYVRVGIDLWLTFKKTSFDKVDAKVAVVGDIRWMTLPAVVHETVMDGATYSGVSGIVESWERLGYHLPPQENDAAKRLQRNVVTRMFTALPFSAASKFDKQLMFVASDVWHFDTKRWEKTPYLLRPASLEIEHPFIYRYIIVTKGFGCQMTRSIYDEGYQHVAVAFREKQRYDVWLGYDPYESNRWCRLKAMYPLTDYTSRPHLVDRIRLTTSGDTATGNRLQGLGYSKMFTWHQPYLNAVLDAYVKYRPKADSAGVAGASMAGDLSLQDLTRTLKMAAAQKCETNKETLSLILCDDSSSVCSYRDDSVFKGYRVPPPVPQVSSTITVEAKPYLQVGRSTRCRFDPSVITAGTLRQYADAGYPLSDLSPTPTVGNNIYKILIDQNCRGVFTFPVLWSNNDGADDSCEAKTVTISPQHQIVESCTDPTLPAIRSTYLIQIAIDLRGQSKTTRAVDFSRWITESVTVSSGLVAFPGQVFRAANKLGYRLAVYPKWSAISLGIDEQSRNTRCASLHQQLVALSFKTPADAFKTFRKPMLLSEYKAIGLGLEQRQLDQQRESYTALFEVLDNMWNQQCKESRWLFPVRWHGEGLSPTEQVCLSKAVRIQNGELQETCNSEADSVIDPLYFLEVVFSSDTETLLRSPSKADVESAWQHRYSLSDQELTYSSASWKKTLFTKDVYKLKQRLWVRLDPRVQGMTRTQVCRENVRHMCIAWNDIDNSVYELSKKRRSSSSVSTVDSIGEDEEYDSKMHSRAE